MYLMYHIPSKSLRERNIGDFGQNLILSYIHTPVTARHFQVGEKAAGIKYP